VRCGLWGGARQGGGGGGRQLLSTDSRARGGEGSQQGFSMARPAHTDSPRHALLRCPHHRTHRPPPARPAALPQAGRPCPRGRRRRQPAAHAAAVTAAAAPDGRPGHAPGQQQPEGQHPAAGAQHQAAWLVSAAAAAAGMSSGSCRPPSRLPACLAPACLPACLKPLPPPPAAGSCWHSPPILPPRPAPPPPHPSCRDMNKRTPVPRLDLTPVLASLECEPAGCSWQAGAASSCRAQQQLFGSPSPQAAAGVQKLGRAGGEPVHSSPMCTALLPSLPTAAPCPCSVPQPSPPSLPAHPCTQPPAPPPPALFSRSEPPPPPPAPAPPPQAVGPWGPPQRAASPPAAPSRPQAPAAAPAAARPRLPARLRRRRLRRHRRRKPSTCTSPSRLGRWVGGGAEIRACLLLTPGRLHTLPPPQTHTRTHTSFPPPFPPGAGPEGLRGPQALAGDPGAAAGAGNRGEAVGRPAGGAQQHGGHGVPGAQAAGPGGGGGMVVGGTRC
jgi:hypothetical protein